MLVTPACVERDPQVFGPGARGEGVLEADEAVPHEVEQRLIQRLHAVVVALGQHLLELVDPHRVGDAVDDLRGAREDLDGRHAALAVGPLEEPLADDAPQRGDQRLARLRLLGRGEQVDEARHGVGDPGGPHGGDDQVAHLSRGQRRAGGLGVGDLPDEDDVGVLSQPVAQGRRVAGGVGAHLPLGHDGLGSAWSTSMGSSM